MSLESASWISELSTSDPDGGDAKSQGDDHLRLIKTVLKATFPTASKAWYNPNTVAKTANYSVLSTDMNKTILIDTDGGSFNITLPSLSAGDAGWECFLLKTTNNDTPYFVLPPSGTLRSGEYKGLSKCRRCIPGSRVQCLWTGTEWIVQRSVGVPLGTIIPTAQYTTSTPHNAAKPYGWEYVDGGALGATDYPEYNAVIYTAAPDARARFILGMDFDATGRVTNAVSGLEPSTYWDADGAQSRTIAQANLPSVNLTTSIASGQGSHSHDVKYTGFGEVGSGPGSVTKLTSISSGGTSTGSAAAVATTLPAMTGTTPLGGSGTALATLPPAIAFPFVMAVE